MPEIIDREELAITKDLRESSPFEIRDLVQSYDRELVGQGRECVVIDKKGKPEKVLAISYRGFRPETAKEIFYLQRIFSTLFPHNFPHFYAAFGEYERGVIGGKKISGTVRERVSKTDQEVEHPFSRVLEFCQEHSVPVDFDVEGQSTHFNLIVGEDGGEYYLDTIDNLYTLNLGGSWRKAEIMQHMDEAESEKGDPLYTKIEKRIVRKSMERLADLDLIKLAKPSRPET